MRPADPTPGSPGYAGPQGRSATLAVYVRIDPGPAVGRGDLEEIVEEVARRVDNALVGIFQTMPVQVEVDAPIRVGAEHVPFFPATIGEEVYEDPTDVSSAINELRIGTPAEGMLFDCLGRAFVVHVYTTFLRAREHDRNSGAGWTRDRSWWAGTDVRGHPHGSESSGPREGATGSGEDGGEGRP